jgi:hypothetical protein
MQYVSVVPTWPLLVLCGIMLAFAAYCFTNNA